MFFVMSTLNMRERISQPMVFVMRHSEYVRRLSLLMGFCDEVLWTWERIVKTHHSSGTLRMMDEKASPNWDTRDKKYDDNVTMVYHDNRQWRQLTSGLRSWRTRIDCQPGRNRAWRQVGTGRRSDEGSGFDSLFFIVGSVLLSRSSRWFLRAGTTELEYELSCTDLYLC